MLHRNHHGKPKKTIGPEVRHLSHRDFAPLQAVQTRQLHHFHIRLCIIQLLRIRCRPHILAPPSQQSTVIHSHIVAAIHQRKAFTQELNITCELHTQPCITHGRAMGRTPIIKLAFLHFSGYAGRPKFNLFSIAESPNQRLSRSWNLQEF